VLPLLTRMLSPSATLQAGIAIGRNQLCAVTLEANGKSHAMRSIFRHELSAPLFSGVPTAAADTALDAGLLAVGDALKSQFALVHIALPDTVIRSAVFELDELPKTVEMRDALMRWRFAKDWQRPEDSLECRGQDFGSAEGKRLLLGQACDRAWSDCVKRALARADITPCSLNAAATYRYNRFHPVFEQGVGAMLTLDPDGWTLLMWDATRRVRRILARLRGSASAEEMDAMADESARAILSTSAGNVGKLYLAGNVQEMIAMAARLEQRLRLTAVPLHAAEGVSGNTTWAREGMAPLALAAAMSK
jgi:hypothetical protein